ncbi:hypothetical protein B0J14DRAFT_540278 [Halenospora varia]|nr:hypothetical protein B0J14DRAFT_540278 [Halenospora varia]
MPEFEGALAPPEGVTPDFEHPKDHVRTLNIVVQSLCVSIVTLHFFVRMYVRVNIQQTLGREDYMCIISWTVFVLYCANTLTMSYSGGGFHQWEVTKQTHEVFLQILYRNSIIYGPAALLVRITLLLLSMRVFAAFRKTVISIYIFMGFMAAYYLIVLIIKIRICTPIASFWDSSIEGACFNEPVLFIADTIVSVLTDFGVLAIPIPLIWTLRLGFWQKVRILTLLGAGAVASGVTVLRLILVVDLVESPDMTIDVVVFSMLGTIELAIGLLCACAPALHALLMRIIDHRQEKSRIKSSSPDIELGASPRGSVGVSQTAARVKGTKVPNWSYEEVREEPVLVTDLTVEHVIRFSEPRAEVDERGRK